MTSIESICKQGSVIPVVTLERAEDALPVADALLAGGMKTIEITLRTAEALSAIELLRTQQQDIMVGAGTITDVLSYTRALDSGAEFLVSPGSITPLLDRAFQDDTPFLPGITTVSEAMHARSYGCFVMKFFPAVLAGGTKALKYFSSILPDIRFCPTGGIEQNTLEDYYQLSNVLCVGGSWVASKELIQEKNWKQITENARLALEVTKANG